MHDSVKHIDADAAYDRVETNRDLIKGIKVLSSGMRVGPNDLAPLRVAREVAEATGLPLMCHIGEVPPGLGAILPLLRPGDIVTHAYKGRKACLVIAGDKVRPGGLGGAGARGALRHRPRRRQLLVGGGARRSGAGLSARYHLHRPAREQRRAARLQYAIGDEQVPAPRPGAALR